MPLRPRPAAPAAVAAADRIIERRRRCDDRDRDRIPEHPFGVAQYATSHLHVPADVIAADIADVTIILDHQTVLCDQVRLASLRAHTRAGLSLAQLAKLLGLHSRQAAEAWMTRLAAAAENLPKREGNVRPGRAQARATRATAQTYAQKIRALAVALLEQADAMPPEITDDLFVDELGDHLGRWPVGAVPTEGIVNALRFLLGQLAAADLPADSRLADLVAAGVDLVGTRVVPDVT